MPQRAACPVNIIAVEDVKKTSKLLVEIFAWKSVHGGAEFDILMDKDNVPTLMLHDYDADDHARFVGVATAPKGVGQSMYVFVDDIHKTLEAVEQQNVEIVEPLFLNGNSKAKEFTFRIPEGYQFSVCETNEWLFYAV